jgi:glycosyltransferase involved in cell wall biosynthesis
MVALEDNSSVLLLHTDHPDLNYFYSLIIGLGLSDRVEIIDGEENFFEIISSADVLVLPTAGAGTGGYALSALAMGIPVLGVDASDLREWLGEPGLLFEAGNVGELSELLASARTKESHFQEIFARARRRAEEFSSDWSGRALKQISQSFE